MTIRSPALERARQLDEQDELAFFRRAFHVPPGVLYLDGNSLGLLSADAQASLLRALAGWKEQAVEAWTEGEGSWFTLPEDLAARLAPMMGAAPDEVIVANSTTVNLHQLLATLFHPHRRRRKILADMLAFPSDVHAIKSQLRLRGLDPGTDLVRAPSADGYTLCEDEIIRHMSEEVHTAVLPSVLYTSSQLLDVARLAAAARERGILFGVDCSHSVGLLPHRLSEWGVDFAFWCHYKYVNGGPGCPGGLFLHRRHADRAPGLAGWFSSRKDRQFDMAHDLVPAGGAPGLQIGSPPILSMAPLAGALEVIERAGLERIRRKSLQLTGFLIELAERELSEFGFRIATPREDHRRGGHVALVHSEAPRLCKALRAEGVVPDHRPPDLIRLAPIALYNSFADCCEAVARLKRVMEERAYERFPEGRGMVP